MSPGYINIMSGSINVLAQKRSGEASGVAQHSGPVASGTANVTQQSARGRRERRVAAGGRPRVRPRAEREGRNGAVRERSPFVRRAADEGGVGSFRKLGRKGKWGRGRTGQRIGRVHSLR